MGAGPEGPSVRHLRRADRQRDALLGEHDGEMETPVPTMRRRGASRGKSGGTAAPDARRDGHGVGMRGTQAKRLRREAERATAKLSPARTRSFYRHLKREYKQRTH
jgi:hypothetical protein